VSFSLFVVAVAEPFAEKDFRDVFGPFYSAHPLGGWLIRYDDRNETVIDCTFSRDRKTDSFAVSRPCSDPRLFQALHSLMTARLSFLTYPAASPMCLVATDEAAAHARHSLAVDSPDLARAVSICTSWIELRDRCLTG